MAEKERLYYVDWLRVFVILSLIPYHAALTYTGLGDIYIKTPIHNISVLPFLFITAPLDSFFMTLLFFLSGIATFYSFQHRSKSDFKKERVRKVLIPLLAGTVLLCPLQAYFKALNEGFSGNYISFIPEFFSGKIVDYLAYAHLWFLLYLFVFSFVCIPLFSKWTKEKAKLNRFSEFLCKGNNILLPILFIVVAEILLRPFFPGKQTLIFDLANDTVYLSMFIFGFVFASDYRIQDRVISLIKVFRITFPLIAIFYIAIQYFMVTTNNSSILLSIGWIFTKGIYQCSAIVFFIWLGKKYLNRKSRIQSYLSKASFTYYVFHFVPVSMFTYFFLRVTINVYAKYLIVVLLSYLFIFTVYEVLVKRIWRIFREK